MTELNKIILSERDMPTHWYNINADLPAAGVEMFPPRHPGTGQPPGPGDLALTSTGCLPGWISR